MKRRSSQANPPFVPPLIAGAPTSTTTTSRTATPAKTKIKEKDPNLAKAWDNVDRHMEAALRAAKEDLKASGISTKELDKRLKRFN